MLGNLIGERFVALNFGESHGRCVGTVVDGCPAGYPLKNLLSRKTGSAKAWTVNSNYSAKGG